MALETEAPNPYKKGDIATEAYVRVPPEQLSSEVVLKKGSFIIEVWYDKEARDDSDKVPLRTISVHVVPSLATSNGTVKNTDSVRYVLWDDVFESFPVGETTTDGLRTLAYEHLKTLDEIVGMDLTQATDV